MERNGIGSRITGDNYRDYKKYLEIQKMNSGSNYIFLNNNAKNINNNNLNINNNSNFNNNNNANINNTINNKNINKINNDNQSNKSNPMNITTNSTNSRVPFVYIPMNRPPSSDITKKNNINMEEENQLLYQNNNKTLNPNSNYSNLNYIDNLDDNKNMFFDENSERNRTNKKHRR